LIGAIAAAGYFLLQRPPDIRDFWAVRGAWDAAGEETDDLQNVHAARCLKVHEKHPGSVGGLSALFLAATRAPKTAAGNEAHRQLAQQIETADMGRLAAAFDRGVVGNWRTLENLSPAFLARARHSPDHPKAARLLAAACTATLPHEDGKPPAVYAESADLIADKYGSSPDITHFCEGLRAAPPWTAPYERHLRAILKVNQDRFVRCSAQFALANVVQAAGEDRQGEAQALFEQFLAEFDGKFSYHAQGIEQQYIVEANGQLVELRQRAVGQPVPEITGIDLDDKPLKLSDYRGRVVLLNFWGTWCFPCMKLIPHEIELVETFQGQPFDIVGVNCDTDIPKARAAVVRTGLRWRSFRNQIDGKPTITTQWKVVGYPCLYLIDHHGTIRKRWVGSPPTDEMVHMVGVLVDAAQRNVSADAMKPVVASMPLPAAKANLVITPATVASQPGSGFVEKVYRAPDGSQSKYVVFAPRNYDGTKSFPAILYLHGAGSRGTDGKLPIKYGLAKAIRERQEDFPFIAIFPQAREGENWTAESASGKRALAILEQVQMDYRIDADRVSLTGHSMGGQGTWSLAAADNRRWAAIVPVSHGGDTKSAPRLIDIPCWCFHGDADKVISVQQSREMARAINEAGGRVLCQEFGGVGHNEAADSAYALPDLYEWLLLQNRAER
jgi:thiol-disulfide isomerase/thioredoxin